MDYLWFAIGMLEQGSGGLLRVSAELQEEWHGRQRPYLEKLARWTPVLCEISANLCDAGTLTGDNPFETTRWALSIIQLAYWYTGRTVSLEAIRDRYDNSVLDAFVGQGVFEINDAGSCRLA